MNIGTAPRRVAALAAWGILAAQLGCASVPQPSARAAASSAERDARVALAVGHEDPPRVGVLAAGKVCGEQDAAAVVDRAAAAAVGSAWFVARDSTAPLRLRVTAPQAYNSQGEGSIHFQLVDAENVVVLERDVLQPTYRVPRDHTLRGAARPAWDRRIGTVRTREPTTPVLKSADEEKADHQAAVAACITAITPEVERTLATILLRDVPRMVERARGQPPLPDVGAWAPPAAADRVFLEAMQAGTPVRGDTVVRGFGCGYAAEPLAGRLRDAWQVDPGPTGKTAGVVPMAIFRQDDDEVTVTVQLRTRGNLVAWQQGRSIKLGRWFGSRKDAQAAQARCVEDAANAVAEMVDGAVEDGGAAVLSRVQSGGRGVPAVPAWRVAVLEFHADAAYDAPALARLSDAARAGAADVLDTRRFTIMTREGADTLLKDQGLPPATEGEDDVVTARNVGAHFVITGHAARVDGTWVVTLKLIDVQTGALLRSDDARAPTPLGLVDAVRAVAASLARRVPVPG